MRDGSRWRCARCDNRESGPLKGPCSGCGVMGSRYPLKTGTSTADTPQRARRFGRAFRS